MDEAKEKGDSVSIVSGSSVTVSETVVETMACEDRIRIKEGGEAGLGNGDDVTVEVLDSHVHIDGGDGGAVQARSIDEAVCGHQESSKVGLEVNMRTLDSECHAVGGLGSRNEVLGGEARVQNEVNGGVVRSCSNDVVCGCDESDEVGLEGNPSTLDSEGDLAGDLGSRYEVSGGEAKAWNEVNGARVLGFSALDSSAGKNAEQSSGINEGGGDLNQATETGKVGNLDSYELNHGNQKRVVCLSAASEDSGVQTKIVEEAAMAIDEEDLNALDGGQETPISEPIKKAANVNVDAASLNVNTLVTAECVPDSEAKDPVYSCQSTGSIAAGQLDEKVSSNMEIGKQGTDSEQQQMEVKTPHLSTQKHDTGNVQSLKPEPIIDGGEGVGLSTVEAVLAEKQVSDAKEVGFDAEQDVKIGKMGVSPKNHDASDVSEPLGHQMDVFVGSGEGEASKVDNNVLNLISPAVASDKELQSSGNEDPLAKNVVSEDDSSVGQEMNVEDQITSDEPDCLGQVEEMEVVEHDSDSDQPTNVDEQTVKQTALKSLSGVKMHQAQQLLSEEGGFSVSDLVWGKVKSHPWWPGQIFDPSDASKKAVKYQKKDSFLVAYFGDRTFAWNEPSVLKPFRTHFSQIVKQSNLESFENAVNCALKEVSRRVELGLACPCIPKDAYDRIKFQKVENTGVQEESSLRDGVDVSLSVSSFEPDKLIDYMKALAESPYSGGDRIDLVIAKAQLLAFYRLKGYHQLPESQFSEEKGLEVVDCATPMDTDGEQKSEASKMRRRSYLKRKHNLKDGLYPSKKERSLSELMSETFDSPDGEIGSDVIGNKAPSSSFGKKRKAIDSSEDSVMQERRKTSKGSLSTPHFPKPSFKIGERISRAASQMAGSPSILKSSGDRLQKLDGGCETPATCGYDVPIDNLEDAERKRMGILTEYSSLDELLLQLHLAACDSMKGYSSLNIIISFFSDFRDSIVLDRLSRDKAVGQRKKSPNSIIGFSETFEFEDMSDTYWTDRIVQNGSEEQPSLGTDRGQYQFVPVELDKPIQKVRKSRKRYSDTSHDLTAQKPPGYVDERAPAEIVMSFPEINSVPSETKLNKMFKHFGPLKESETEVDCETSRARVVFRRSSDAEVAYNSARKFNIFGPVSVTYQLNYTISESFKASLYAPTLAEENPFIASAPCGDHALIAPSLGEEASFMVSTLGDETLPIATTFHEEPWFIASTTGEDTLAIPTTLADGALDVATTMYEKTLPVTTTAGVETMADATTIVDKTFTVATTVGEQSLPVFTTIDEQTSTAAASLVDEASFSHLTSSKGTSTMTTTLGDQTSSIATFHPEIPSVPATVGEETCSIPAPSGEETCSILPNLDAETPIHPVTLAEESPSISRILGEDTPSVPAAFNEEAPVDTLIFSGGTHTLPGKLDRETKTVPTTLCEETTIPATLGQETPTLPATLGEETHSIPSTSSDENRGIPTNLDEETTPDPVTLAEESPSIPETLGEETPSVPSTFSEETPAVPPSFSEATTIPPSFNEETPTVPVTLGPETLTISTTTSEETAKIPATSGEETTSAPVTLHEETLAIPTTLEEGSPTMTTKLDEETSTSPTNLAEETLTTPTSYGVEASTVLTTNSEETCAVSTTTEMETLPPAGAESVEPAT